ncbi:hypothetical protein [Sorangium sp. So ce861]|uniref:hypothetical protein n=1 Tax=Sorangium sp. So ce861 TaxID=3133323 RepID=UPI003F6433AF
MPLDERKDAVEALRAFAQASKKTEGFMHATVSASGDDLIGLGPLPMSMFVEARVYDDLASGEPFGHREPGPPGLGLDFSLDVSDLRPGYALGSRWNPQSPLGQTGRDVFGKERPSAVGSLSPESAAMIKEIAGRHMFDDANKRAAQAVYETLAARNRITSGSSGGRVRSIIDQVAREELKTVEENAAGLRGF